MFNNAPYKHSHFTQLDDRSPLRIVLISSAKRKYNFKQDTSVCLTRERSYMTWSVWRFLPRYQWYHMQKINHWPGWTTKSCTEIDLTVKWVFLLHWATLEERYPFQSTITKNLLDIWYLCLLPTFFKCKLEMPGRQITCPSHWLQWDGKMN